jgi:hypothetical protein
MGNGQSTEERAVYAVGDGLICAFAGGTDANHLRLNELLQESGG